MQNMRKTDVKNSNKKCLHLKFNHLYPFFFLFFFFFCASCIIWITINKKVNKLNLKLAFLILSARSVAVFKPLTSPRSPKFWAKMSFCKNKMFNRVRHYTYSLIHALVYITLLCRRILGDDMKLLVGVRIVVATIFWFYDRGRLERVGIATFRLGWVLIRPFPPLFCRSFKKVLSWTKTSAWRPKKTPTLQAI